MKLLTFFALFSLFASAASTYSQQAKFSMALRGVTVREVFKEIENHSEFILLYNEKQLDVNRKVSVNADNQSVDVILNQLFEGTSNTYKIYDRQIVILLDEKAGAPERTKSGGEIQQKKPVTGTVKDKDGNPIPGAAVLVKGTTIGTITDVEGRFNLAVPVGAKTLLVSFVGMTTREIRLEDKSSFSVVLEMADNKVDEVVVTGMFTKKAESFTGSISTVTSKELQMAGNRNVITSLRNIEPSFNIIESNAFGSDPNRLPEIQIRGNSSIPNVNELQDQTRVGLNTPLVILDGFESSLKKLLDLNQNEIESMTVLKDAAATAIYGSRGSNGVVVIQTKTPIAGKLRISYRGDVNIESPDLTGYSLLDAREKLDLEYKVGLYNTARAEGDVPLKKYYNFLLNEVNRGINTDWMALPLHLGVGNRHNLKVEGGDQTFRYSASAQVNRIQGVMIGSYRNIFNGTINLMYNYKNVKFTDQLLIGLGNSANSPYGSFSDYVKMNPYWNPYDENGNVNKVVGYPGDTYHSGRFSPLPTNPLYNATLNTFDKTNQSSITNNFMIEWLIIKDLRMRSKIGLTKNIDQTDRFRPSDHTAFANYTIENIFRKGDYAYGITNDYTYEGSLNLGYSKVIAEKHSIFAGFDYNIRQKSESVYGFLAEGFSNPKFDFLPMALQYAQGGKPSGSEGLTRSIGATANVNYSYNDRYFIDFSFREDGSSQFGSKKRFAPFWSTGLAWNLLREGFMKNVKVFDRLKLRGSMGITGSQNFKSYQALSTYQYYTADRYYTWMGSYLRGLGNEELRWEQEQNYDIGVESQMFKQRFKFTFDYYLGRTTGLVSSIDLPPSNGFTNYIENIGTMENRGFEGKATVFVVRNPTKGISWSLSGAVFRNVNKIASISESLKNGQNKIIAAGGANPNTLYFEGYSTNTIWVVRSLGIDPSNGKELYLDLAGNPTYTWSSANLQACGVTDPKYQGNFSSMFRYKTFSANVTFGYRYGGQQYNRTLIDKVENADYNYNVDSRVYDDRWQKPGDLAGFKGLLVTTKTQMTSRFVQDENTLTCQNINLQYDLRNKSLKQNLGVELLSFSANMGDLFYLSTVKRERGTSYPFSHNFSFSVSATF